MSIRGGPFLHTAFSICIKSKLGWVGGFEKMDHTNQIWKKYIFFLGIVQIGGWVDGLVGICFLLHNELIKPYGTLAFSQILLTLMRNTGNMIFFLGGGVIHMICIDYRLQIQHVLKLKADRQHPRDYSTCRQTPWTDNYSSLLFLCESRRTDGRTDGRYQVHDLPWSIKKGIVISTRSKDEITRD